MKIDFNIKLLKYTGESLRRPKEMTEEEEHSYKSKLLNKENPKLEYEDLTLGMVARDGLVNLTVKQSEELKGDKKLERWSLAQKIFEAEKENEPLDLEINDLALLKKIIGESFGPAVVGPAWNILEQKN